ncbi:hypothetical protein TSAR_015525 [Trichomalopsis sarcophagae]|uniref:Uncharacterized protein n=1 Tax=Trichomalopsis sarcophagae TaxID=543379 RepID=A0A232F189_9HYME|nr:hypothetical protein TSAR_015525 [Trichomalopsis sarcophagae]
MTLEWYLCDSCYGIACLLYTKIHTFLHVHPNVTAICKLNLSRAWNLSRATNEIVNHSSIKIIQERCKRASDLAKFQVESRMHLERSASTDSTG